MSTPQDPPETITVYVINGTSTSQGNGPGAKDLPADEALRLMHESLAVRGTRPPMGMYGGGFRVRPNLMTG